MWPLYRMTPPFPPPPQHNCGSQCREFSEPEKEWIKKVINKKTKKHVKKAIKKMLKDNKSFYP